MESRSPRVLGAGLGVGREAGAALGARRPTRLVCIGNMLGFYQPAFFPPQTGRGYALPSLLQPMAPLQNDFTLYSNLDHGVKGGHFAIHSHLSDVRQVDANGMPEGNLSLDGAPPRRLAGPRGFPRSPLAPKTACTAAA